MRFITFKTPDAAARVGVMLEGEPRFVDLGHAGCAPLLDGCAPSLLAMLERGLRGFVQRIATSRVDSAAWLPLSSVQLLAPLQPGKIIGAAFNFTDALDERGMQPPPEPVTFFRSGCTVVGPGEPVLIPPDVGNVTYEAELAVVIGRRCLQVSA